MAAGIEQAALNAAHSQRAFLETVERSYGELPQAFIEAARSSAESLAELCESIAGERCVLREREEMLRTVTTAPFGTMVQTLAPDMPVGGDPRAS
jgi:hypothetical protein